MARSSVKKSKSTRRGSVSSGSTLGFGKQMLKLGGDALIRQAQKYIAGQSRTRLEQALKKKQMKKKGRITQGVYVGRFNRKSSKTFKQEKLYGDKGALSSVEVSGNVNDNNVCWVGHTTSMQFEVQRLFLIALYRRIVEKISMMKIESSWSQLSEYNLTGAILSIETADHNDGSYLVHTYTIQATDTLDSLSVYTNTVSAQLIGLVGEPTPLTNRLYRYLRLSFAGAGSRYAQIDLRGVQVHYHLKSVLKVQNASTFTAGDNEADDVNAVHLTGRMFHFKTANPNPRKFVMSGSTGDNVQLMSDLTGVNLQRGELISYWDRAWGEVPTKQMFTNCSAASKINLEPGKIKTDRLIYQKSARFIDFLRIWSEPSNADTNLNSDYRRGPLNMLILEKQINFGSNRINLYYEKQQNIGVYITETYANAMLQDFYTRAFSKVAAP